MEDTLRKCADFNILTNEEITDLAKIGKKETFQQEQQVFSINHEGNKFFILVEGRLTLRLKRNISKTYYKAGDLFGEVAILGDTLRFGTIMATEDTDLISIHRDDLFHSEFISKELALKIPKGVVFKYIKTTPLGITPQLSISSLHYAPQILAHTWTECY